MYACIRDYNLFLMDFDKRKGGHQIFNPEWDNWVRDEDDIKRLVEYIRYEITKGRKPIVTVFCEKSRSEKGGKRYVKHPHLRKK